MTKNICFCFFKEWQGKMFLANCLNLKLLLSEAFYFSSFFCHCNAFFLKLPLNHFVAAEKRTNSLVNSNQVQSLKEADSWGKCNHVHVEGFCGSNRKKVQCFVQKIGRTVASFAGSYSAIWVEETEKRRFCYQTQQVNTPLQAFYFFSFFCHCTVSFPNCRWTLFLLSLYHTALLSTNSAHLSSASPIPAAYATKPSRSTTLFKHVKSLDMTTDYRGLGCA